MSEDGLSWRCKDKTCVGDRVEIVLPVGVDIDAVDRDDCKIERDGDSYFIIFKKIVSKRVRSLTVSIVGI